MTTLLTFLLFTGLVAAVTWWLTRGDDHESTAGYFLAGRTLTGGIIAGSLMLTNLSTEQLVGLNGLAFSQGLSVMAWEVGAAIALVAMALYFLPKFLRSGIATVPQYLEERYGPSTRAATTIIFILAYAVILLPILLYTGALGLSGMLNLQALMGFESEAPVIWITVVVVGLIGSFYAIWGGLRTVAVSDTLNGFGLLVGGVMITVFGLNAVAGDDGGIIQGFRTLRESHPEKFNSIGGPNDDVPFFTLFSGVLIINLFYWCTNQQIIQRTLGASSLAEGQKGVFYAGFLKVIAPVILVFPGLIAFHLYADQGVRQDEAYGTLVRNVLPMPLTGFFAAVMVGAILSSFNSALNSTATLFSLGVYKKMLRPEASHRQVVASGRIVSAVVAIISVATAPLLMGQESIFSHLQSMNSVYFIPLFTIVFIGMIDRTASAKAANIALGVSLIAMILGAFVFNDQIREAMNFFHFAGLVFVGSAALLLVLGKMMPREQAFVHHHSGDVDLTPWKHAKLAAALLLGVVVVIYAIFADFSVLNG